MKQVKDFTTDPEQKLLSIARDFFHAAAKYEDDDSFLYKMAEHVEMDFLMERMEVGTDLASISEELGLMRDYNKEYMDLAIKAADMTAECHLKTTTFNNVASYLSDDQRSQEISDGFAKKGAKNLSRLTKP